MSSNNLSYHNSGYVSSVDKNSKIDFIASEYDCYDVVDMKIFDYLVSQSEGDTTLIREIYFSYFSEAEILIKLINDYFNKNNYEKLLKSINSLSKISATVGATKLLKVARDNQNAIKQNDYDKVKILNPILHSSYLEFKKYVNKLL